MSEDVRIIKIKESQSTSSGFTSVGKSTGTMVSPVDVVEAIINGEVHTAEELATKFNLPILKSVQILNDPQFLQVIGNYSKAKANLNFHTKGIQKLINIAESNDNKEAMSAIKILAQYTNNVKSTGNDVNVNLNLNTLLDHADKNEKDFPVINIESLK
jgi:hypothetical protein